MKIDTRALHRKILFTLLMLIIISTFYYISVDVRSVYFIVTNVTITMFSVISLVARSNIPYSMYTMFFLFSLFFYGLVPALEVTQQVSYWGGTPLAISAYNYTNSIVILSLILFQTIYSIGFGSISIDKDDILRSKFILEYEPKNKLLLFFVLLIFIILTGAITFWYNNLNLYSMFFRGGEFTDRVSLQGSAWLLYHYFIKPIPAVCTVVFILLYGINRYSIMLLILLFLICSPTSMARFQAAVIYIPVFIVMFKNLRKEFLFPGSIMISLLLLFPLLDKFRHLSIEDEFDFRINYDFLLAGHFDSYQNFVRIFDLDITTYGWQLMGALFFFVPRNLWENKPIGSGHYLADVANLKLSNISLNFLGEGYINFGLLGVILFVSMLSIFCAMYDRLFWKTKSKYNLKTANIFYLFSLGLVFFLLRGDLMSSFAYSVGMLCTTILVMSAVNQVIK